MKAQERTVLRRQHDCGNEGQRAQRHHQRGGETRDLLTGRTVNAPAERARHQQVAYHSVEGNAREDCPRAERSQKRRRNVAEGKRVGEKRVQCRRQPGNACERT